MSEGLTEWESVITAIIERLRELKEADASRETIAEGLTALKVFGCSLGTEKSGGREYLRVRWFGKGRREETTVGPIDLEMRRALKAAGLYLEARSG